MSKAAGPSVTIRRFEAADQDAVRWLILRGLGEHFGTIDERINTDLDEIASSYREADFLLACEGGAIVATGALMSPENGVARIVRMSCAASHRRRGIGTAIVRALLEHARHRGCGRITLATNEDRDDANSFYRTLGFVETTRPLGGVVYELRL